jgi:hypothetical protein
VAKGACYRVESGGLSVATCRDVTCRVVDGVWRVSAEELPEVEERAEAMAREREWGGEPEIRAIAAVFQRPVRIWRYDR